MEALRRRLAAMSPAERLVLLAGVPVVVVMALVAAVRARRTPAEDANPEAATTTGAGEPGAATDFGYGGAPVSGGVDPGQVAGFVSDFTNLVGALRADAAADREYVEGQIAAMASGLGDVEAKNERQDERLKRQRAKNRRQSKKLRKLRRRLRRLLGRADDPDDDDEPTPEAKVKGGSTTSALPNTTTPTPIAYSTAPVIEDEVTVPSGSGVKII